MIVVSDNGPIGFLIQIGREELLQRLYGEVLVPPAVMRELGSPGTPPVIREWIENPPAWLHEQAPVGYVSLEGPGAGERQAIQLAKEKGTLLLCDDRPAMNHARREGLNVTGTLGILQLAHERNWIEIEAEIDKRRAETSMHLPEDRIHQIIAHADQMRQFNRRST